MKTILLKTMMIGMLAFTFTSCFNAIEKTMLEGDYDTALEAALPKLKNDRKKDEYINLAVNAYNKVMEEDKYKIERLKTANEAANWGKVFYIYKEMERRQTVIEPYLPLIYKDGSEAEIETFNYIRVIEEARKYAAAYHYDRAKEMLEQPYKEAARDAFYELNQIDQFYATYYDKEALKFEAKEKGTNHVFMEFKSAYGINLPTNFLQHLSEYNYESSLRGWTQLHRTRTDSSQFDMIIKVSVDGVVISPEHIKEARFHEDKQVADGYKDLLDSEGNVVVDSLGNAIQVEKFKTLHCDITEWTQTKSARIISSFEIYDTRYNKKVITQPISDEVHFLNNYARAYGHTDILDNHYHEKLRGRPLPFPTNADMVFQTAESLKKQVSNSLNRNDDVLASL